MSDAAVFGVSLIGLVGLVGVGEVLRRGAGWSAAVTRRLVHIGVGVFVAATPFLFEAPSWIYVLAVLFVGANAWTWRQGWFEGMHGTRRDSVGTITFPLALIPALFVSWSLDADRVVAMQVAFLVLALADPAASVVGTRWGRARPIRMQGAVKSAAGSLVFFAVAFGITFLTLGLLEPDRWTLTGRLGLALVVAGATTAVELLGGRGWDNFFIVQTAVVVVVVGIDHIDQLGAMLGALGLGLVFGVAAYRLRFLDRAGSIAGGLLAASLVGLGGWAWAAPAFTFFFLSSVLSKLGRRRKAVAAEQDEKGHVRDAGQVYANGGIGWALLLAAAIVPASWLYAEGLYWAFLGAFGAATADTWATEIGTLVGGRPRSLRTGQPVPPGTSGAVSVAGSLGALAGAFAIWGTAWAVAGPGWRSADLGWALLAVAGGGLLASFVDSLLGATVQARYRSWVSGRETERASTQGRPNDLVRGWRWLNNDRVNLVATAVGALFALACFVRSVFAS